MNEALQPYPAYKSSGTDWPDKTPEHWELQRLRATVASHTTGTWGLDPDGVNDLPCIRVADFDRGRLRVRADNPTLRSIKPTDRPKRTLQQGNLLLEKSGGGEKQPVGNIVLYDHQLVAVTSNFIERLTLQHDHNPAFFVYLHSALYAKGVNIRSIKQTTGIQNLDVSSYLSETVGAPDLSEQNAIVRYLDHADELINRYIGAKERLIALMREQRQAVIHQAVTRGLDPDVHTKPGEIPWLENIPKHWDVRRLGQLATKFGSGVTPRGGAAVYRDTGVPFLRSQNVHFDGLRLDDVVRIPPNLHESMSASHVQPHDVLLNITGASIGRVCSVPHDLGQGNVNQHVCIIRPNQERLLSRFLVAFLSTSGAQNDIRTEQTGASREGLTLQSIRDFRIPLPRISEQTRIVHSIDEATNDVYRAIASTSRQIDLANEYRTRLIADVVTGQIDVRDATVELPDQHL